MKVELTKHIHPLEHHYYFKGHYIQDTGLFLKPKYSILVTLVSFDNNQYIYIQCVFRIHTFGQDDVSHSLLVQYILLTCGKDFIKFSIYLTRIADSQWLRADNQWLRAFLLKTPS